MSEAALPPGSELPDTDIMRIMRTIPHRFPLLLVDRVVEMGAFRRAIGIKKVTINEPFFQGHFPSDPIMPGVLMVEAMAQTAAVLVIACLGADFAGNLGLLHGHRRGPLPPARAPGRSSCGSRSRSSAAGSASTKLRRPCHDRGRDSPPRPSSAPR